MTLRADKKHRARIEAVIASTATNFVELVRIAGLDPKTSFRYADLRRCDLHGEDLSAFNFSHTDFTGANVEGTIFTGANLTGAKLAGAIGLDRAILEGAIFEEPATWPIPAWASAAGRDQYGTWAEFTVPVPDGDPVKQRMRWIREGEFLIGSPKGEDGRYDDEGPQKLIRIGEGFWLFDTPCTQALWMAVMGGENPSKFQSPDRPVETVDFDQVAEFIARLNDMKPGIDLSLPSEAQWEYACRAGTMDATYAGPLEILGDNNAPALDPIAWYGGNCGQDFELDNGYDISDFPDKQYDDAKGGTHPVGRKRPNDWGLHDMLGNVWEWCSDEWHDSHKLTPDDGSPFAAARGKRADAAGRVIRGGSWFGDARVARAACRSGGDPARRGVDLGFRCARGRVVSPASDKPRGTGRGKQGSGATGGRVRSRAAPER